MRSYERSGITLEQCDECRGIFLDRGELEKLTQAENAWHGQQPQQQHQPQQPYPPQGGHHGHEQQYSYGGHQYKKKHKHFLEELFD
jgi:Zn-finger nucleic acid-binding protein